MITALLHTRDRPQFALRALRYYDGKLGYPLHVLDASRAAAWDELRVGAERLRTSYPLTLVHRDHDVPLLERLGDALRAVDTPYVLLAADDDLYYPDWIARGIDYLNGDPSCSVVYGQVIFFALERFTPYGELISYAMWRPNPVARWMQASDAASRLRELGRGPWQNGLGWYALQRTSVLRRIVDVSAAAGFSGEMFERALTILQPIYGTSVMLDGIYLARQENADERRRPYTYRGKEGAFAKLHAIATEALVDACGTDVARASEIVHATLAPEIAELRSNDRRSRFRVEDVKERMPRLHRLVRLVKTMPYRVARSEPHPWDSRFPVQPSLDDFHPAVVALRAACDPNSAGARDYVSLGGR